MYPHTIKTCPYTKQHGHSHGSATKNHGIAIRFHNDLTDPQADNRGVGPSQTIYKLELIRNWKRLHYR